MMNERDKAALIAHVLEEGSKEPPPPTSEFEDALFEERIRDYLIEYFGDQDPAKYL